MSSEMSAKIKRLRRENGLTLEQVADAVGVGKSTVRKWETSMIESLRCDKLPALADVLHTTPAYLVCSDPEPTDLADSVPSLDVHALADIIVQYRTDHDLSQRQFSAHCGISNGYIAMIERGMNPKTGKPVVPTIPSLIKIASGMGMALSDLLHAVGFTMEDSVDSSATSGGSSGVGTRIHDLRVGLGLSADELAAKLGKNRATIYRYENGEIDNFPISVIGPLADVLNTTPAYLMGWTESAAPVTSNSPEPFSTVSPQAQKIAAAYDQATAKEKNIVEMILSAYLPAEEDRKAPVRFAAYSKDGKPVDFTGADPNAPIPHPFVKGDDIP